MPDILLIQPSDSLYSEFRRIAGEAFNCEVSIDDNREDYAFKKSEKIVGIFSIENHSGFFPFAYLRNVAIVPEEQGRGYGREMLRKIDDQLANKFYHFAFLMAKQELVPFYEEGGFRMQKSIETPFGVLFSMGKPIIR